MKQERRNYEFGNLECRTEENGDRIIAGYAAKFNVRSKKLGWFYEKIDQGAFARSLSDKVVKALFNHDSSCPLGSTKNGTLSLSEDDIGLRCQITLPNTTAGKDTYESIKRGDIDGMSFSFYTIDDNWSTDDQGNDIRTLREVDLIEVSPVTFPAYPQTSIGLRSYDEIFKEHQAVEKREDKGGEQRSACYLAELRKKRLDLMEEM